MLCLRLRAPLVCAVVCGAVGSLAAADDASACGGCFHEPPPVQVVIDTSVVTDHRMALAISPLETVLWDQIHYSGTPSSFAWVLPVRAGARIELSNDAWLAALDASTQVIITGPTPPCGGAAPVQDGSGGGGGCGLAMSDSASASVSTPAASAAPPPVEVISQSVVGPYDAVTVRSSMGEALEGWLVQNGYEVPAGLQPTIDAYTNAGFDFMALKLRPGQGVQSMQPVRVVTPGADPSLPLRMVAAGIGARVGLELFVVSGGRYHTQNFPDATLDLTTLAWDPYSDVSNYSTLAAQSMAAAGGTAWLTEFAGPVDLSPYGSAGNPNPGLLYAYDQACVPSLPSCLGAVASTDASVDSGPDDGQAESGDVGGDGGPTAADSGVPAAPAPMCASGTACDDLSLAMTGLAAGTIWVTRLRADLPSGALASDLVIEATVSQTTVSNLHTTEKYTDPSYNPCRTSSPGTASAAPSHGASSCACRTTDSPHVRYADAIALVFGSAVMALASRRRRNR